MSISSILDVIIGVAFVFFLFSVLASGVHELVTRALATRSKQLWRAIGNLLDGEPAASTAKTRASEIVLGLNDERDPRPVLATSAPQATKEKLFAHVLIRGLDDTGKLTSWTKSRLSHIEPDIFSRALIDVVSDGADLQDTAAFKTVVGRLPDGELKDELSAIARHAGDELVDLRQDIGSWFDSRMEALTKAYRRRTRWWLFAIGVLVAVGFNVDAVRVTDEFYSDDATRALVVGEAEALVESCTIVDGEPDDTCKAQLESASNALHLPVWWDDADVNGWSMLGWLIAAAAIAQGGPFWFDVLRRLAGFKKAASST